MPDTSFLSWPFFEPRHREFAERLERWAGDNVHKLEQPNVDASCRALVAALGRDGWLAHTAPDPTDAKNAIDVRTLALAREMLARHSGLADFAFAMQGLGAGPISLFGSPAQRATWLTKTRKGQAIAAFALTEAASGSDVANISTSARRDGNGYVIDGEKTWISNGGIADFYVVFARTEAPGARGLSAFIVAADSPGLSIAERLHVIAPHPLARLRFENCPVSQDALIGAPGDGFKIAMATLDVFRATVGAAALGFARRAFDAALDRSSNRQLFGAPLGSLQMVQGHIADMALEIDAAALLIYRAAWAKDNGQVRVTREAAMAKLYATEAAQRVIDAAVQLHGGDGVKANHPVEQLYREIRALRIYEGASDVQRVVIARSLASTGI
ncbi:MAG: acyl-CoA dehydrogenase family protein [Xanthobacteraceae bacterium]